MVIAMKVGEEEAAARKIPLKIMGSLLQRRRQEKGEGHYGILLFFLEIYCMHILFQMLFGFKGKY